MTNETQTSYEELPVQIQRQLQDHVNALLPIKCASVPGGIKFIRRQYDRANPPLKRYEFYGGTPEEYKSNPRILDYVKRLNGTVDSANFALIEETPADLEKIKSLETALMLACYGESRELKGGTR